MGIPTLISTNTGSNTSAITISSGIDSTYDEYMFVMTNIHVHTDETIPQFQFNGAGESGFNETITSSFFMAVGGEADGTASLGYQAYNDQAQGTAYQFFVNAQENDADQAMDGVLHLFNPASTTYVKHFYAEGVMSTVHPRCCHFFLGGYVNTTTAIDEISFKVSSGNISGVIQLYGIA